MKRMPDSFSDARAKAAVAMSQQRWADAGALLAQSADGSDLARARLCLNLAAAQVHRPAVYRAIMTDAGPERYEIAPSVESQPTIHFIAPGGKRMSMSPGNRPMAALQSALTQLKPQLDRGDSLGLIGVGDGYLLSQLAHHPPVLHLGRQQLMHVMEPEPKLLLVAMMLHDLRPALIEGRVFWWVGPDWNEQMRAAVLTDPGIPTPASTVTQCVDGPAANAQFTKIGEAVIAQDRDVSSRIRSYYASLPVDHFARAMGRSLDRPGRVMLLTTRYSTVLQYSTRDSADAFEQMGFETHVVIEPSDTRATTRASMRQQVLAFKPDLVFQIDHLRSEHVDVFPPELPFVCWVQDHLPNLTNRDAGSTVAARDFVLSGMKSMYVGRYGYPARQCIEMTKLTRVPSRPARWISDGDDIVFVSNASATPAVLRDQLLHEAGPAAGVIGACCDAIDAVYASERTLHTASDVGDVVRATLDQLKVRPTGELQPTIDLLFDRYNNAHYRQQALGWAATIAERRGLRLSLYGSGWERHPRFGPFARGPVKYGAPLEELTRRAKMNLQIVPFYCMHQRLLDGLVAGGFFLVRDHPSAAAMHDLADFVSDHLPAGCDSVPAARSQCPAELASQLEALLAACRIIADWGDPVAVVRGAIDMANIVPHQPPMPHLEDVLFDSLQTLDARFERFLHDAEARAQIATRQRAAVEARLSYRAGLSRVLERIVALLSEESPQAQTRLHHAA